MSTPVPCPETSGQEARTQRHLEFLDILIAQGMDLAARFHQQSTTPSDLSSALAAPGIAIPFITPDVIAAFAQINQTVRRAILVSRKLAEPLPPARPAHPAVTRNSADPGTEPRPGVEPIQPDTLRTESADRLQSPGLEDRIGTRHLSEIIAGIGRDLGMDPASAGSVPHSPEPVEAPALRAVPIERPEPDAPAVAPVVVPVVAPAVTPVVTTVLQRSSKPERRPPKR